MWECKPNKPFLLKKKKKKKKGLEAAVSAVSANSVWGNGAL
jgi:hypothetical protein